MSYNAEAEEFVTWMRRNRRGQYRVLKREFRDSKRWASVKNLQRDLQAIEYWSANLHARHALAQWCMQRQLTRADHTYCLSYKHVYKQAVKAKRQLCVPLPFPDRTQVRTPS